MNTSTTIPAAHTVVSIEAASPFLRDSVSAQRGTSVVGEVGLAHGRRTSGGQQRPPGPVIGVTVEIPDPWRGELQAARQECGDPLARIVSPHLTLLAPTVVATHHLERVTAHLALLAERTTPFTIALHGVASFMPLTSVVYVPVIDGGTACTALAANIRNGPVPLSQQFPFHPHVTIAQRVETEALERVCRSLIDFEAIVNVDRYTLSFSDDAAGDPFASWRPVGGFRFTA